MSNPDLDRKLQAFLDREPEAKSKMELTLDGLKTGLANLAAAQQLTSQKLESQNELIQERLKGLNARVDKLEEDVEDTGLHNLESIKAKASEATHAKDRLQAYIVTAAGAVALALLGGAGSVIWYLITKPH